MFGLLVVFSGEVGDGERVRWWDWIIWVFVCCGWVWVRREFRVIAVRGGLVNSS